MLNFRNTRNNIIGSLSNISEQSYANLLDCANYWIIRIVSDCCITKSLDPRLRLHPGFDFVGRRGELTISGQIGFKFRFSLQKHIVTENEHNII